MGDSTRTDDRTRHWELILATAAGIGVIVLLTIAVATAAPPVLVNLSSRFSDGATPFDMASPDGSSVAEITVPEGWVVRRKDATLLIHTPDGVMSAVVELVPVPADRALEGAAGRRPPETEVLSSGRRVVHTDLPRGTGVVAAVNCGTGPGTTVKVTTRIRDGWDAEAYRPALAALLEGIA